MAIVVPLALGSAHPVLADTIAYYRFENAIPGESLGNSANRSILDSSGNGYHANPAHNPVGSSDVPVPVIPKTRETNNRSIQFIGKEDVYGLSDEGLSRVVFTDFTIELWAKFDTLAGWQTLIGRDDAGSPGEGISRQSLFYLSKTTDIKPTPEHTENGLRVELVTRDNQLLSFNSDFAVVTQKWYHIAVVGDAGAGTLALFVNGTEIGGTTGFNGLFVPTANTIWTLGRGQFGGKVIDFFNGQMDEVRFSDRALSSGLFLNARTTP
jgi:hypothetical protein